MTIETPYQILTAATLAAKVRDGSALNDPPRVLWYDTAHGTVLGPALILEPFPADEALSLGRTARAEIRGDEYHRDSCGKVAAYTFERDSCGTCALLGWGAHDDAGHPAPNHGAWALLYLAAREPIPRAWEPALLAALNDPDNDRYRDNVRRHVATFGVRFTESAPGYKLPTPTPETVRAGVVARLEDNGEPYGEDEVRRALAVIADDDDYTRDSRRAAFRAFNRSLSPR